MRVSRLTPPGRGGVALIALEGPAATAWLRAALARPLPPVSGVAVARLSAPGGGAVDEVLVARAGEHAYRLGCHGGPAVTAALEALLARAGARESGEALGASSDRVQVEADAALPFARSALACQVLLRQRAGALAEALRPLIAAPDATPLRRLLATAPFGRALTAAPRVALIGRPNAGKSSLLNALTGRDRAIVSEEAGTTRDAVEEEGEVAGLVVVLTDTAGQRAAADPLEAAGIARARHAAEAADLRLTLLDGALAGDEREAALAEALAVARPRLLAVSKLDLLSREARAGWEALLAAREATACPVSARTGEGLSALEEALGRALVGDDPAALATGPVLFTPRQGGLIEGALRALDRDDPPRAARCLRALLGVHD